MTKDYFWVMADEMPFGATTPFESIDEDVHGIYQTMFQDHFEVVAIVVDPRSILRKIEKREMSW